MVHLGSMAMRGWGSIMVEATAVVPEGRISEHDAVSLFCSRHRISADIGGIMDRYPDRAIEANRQIRPSYRWKNWYSTRSRWTKS
jgi:hypothetical protein